MSPHARRAAGIAGSTHALLLAGVLSFSVLTVYTQYVFLRTTDHVTNRSFRELSLDQYHEILAGRRPFPYQWRVAGPWLVRAGEVATARDPHQIDAVVKIAALALSALVVMWLTARWAAPSWSIAAAALYFALTAAAYSSEGYSIYYTNDFLMVTGWCAAVALVAQRRFGWAAAVTFLTAWAKETVVLVPILVGLSWWHGRATARDWIFCALAFMVPTAFLRTYYPAPLQYWAWWGNVTLNVPLLGPDGASVWAALRNNLKVLLFLNVLWILAYRTVRRTSESFLRDLAGVGLLYMGILYVVVEIRELRHFMPLAAIVVPLAVVELEHMFHESASRERPLRASI